MAHLAVTAWPASPAVMAGMVSMESLARSVLVGRMA
jgi:hypothetical protein